MSMKLTRRPLKVCFAKLQTPGRVSQMETAAVAGAFSTAGKLSDFPYTLKGCWNCELYGVKSNDLMIITCAGVEICSRGSKKIQDGENSSVSFLIGLSDFYHEGRAHEQRF